VVSDPAITVVPESPSIDRDLQKLEAEIKRLEAEYNMYFAGRLPKPPWETRSRVQALIKQYDRAHIQSYSDRFRFGTLQSRFSVLAELWDRGLRAREEGRPGPFATRPKERPDAADKTKDRVLYVTTFQNLTHEMDRLQDLYESLAEARRESGEQAVPFHKFADLVKSQVAKLGPSGSGEVAFRVAVKDGKVSLTARAMKGPTNESDL
jgi:hypothetical protein